MRMRTLISALLVCLSAGQATALSCMRPDVATTFNQMNAVPEDVYVLRGILTFDEGLLPQGVVNEERNPEPIPARFVGKGLTLDGFTARFESPVIVQSLCFGPWCGAVGAGDEIITFAKVLGDKIVVEVDPCGSTVFYEPTQSMVEDLKSCIRGDICESNEL
ncbi:MAG: hypothetical protein AAGC96_22245 [Pseudomonadota bacterium]